MKAIYYEEKYLNQVEDIVKSNTKMHGINITAIVDRFIESFVSVNPLKGSVIVVDENDVISGIIKTSWSDRLPVWTIDFGFMKHRPDRNLVRETIKACSVGVEFLFAEAENRGLFEVFYGVRDHNNHRFDMLADASYSFKNKYEFIDLEVIRPGSKSKYSVFDYQRMILGEQNKKTVVIRHGHLRKEFRPDPWKDNINTL